MGQRYQIKINYLGNLNKVLHDLRGYSTIVNELVQNADDAFILDIDKTKEAKMFFDVRDDALIVQDNAGFTEADFARFSEFASGGKRFEEGTTGAFGIGFTSVYQITDRPELRSGQRHWIMYPEDVQYEEEFIEFFKGTQFRLPWATNPESDVRKGLGLKSVPPNIVQILIDEIHRAIPSAILFLKELSDISLKHNGSLVKQIVRKKDGHVILVREGNDSPQVWYLFRGSFDEEAVEIRVKSQNRIEPKRTSKVELALRDTTNVNGLFHAYLPTEQKIGLPFHINADFFTSSDRKQILLNNDYQGDWNRAAVRAAAKILANTALPKLPDLLGATGFWDFLSSLADIHAEASNGQQEETLKTFWDSAKPQVEVMKSVFCSTGEWQYPEKTCILSNKKEEQPQLSILEQVGLSIVDPELNKYRELLKSVGVPTLVLRHITDALVEAGLTMALSIDEVPQWMQSKENRQMLDAEIAFLIQRSDNNEEKQAIANCSIARSIDNFICPPNQLKITTPDTITVFQSFSPVHYFVAPDEHQDITQLFLPFTVDDALQLLENAPSEKFLNLWQEKSDQLIALINWFSEPNQLPQLQNNLQSVNRLCQLSIWPSCDELYSLASLFVPSEAKTNYFQLKRIVDARLLENHRLFLLEVLGAKKLTSVALAILLKEAGLDRRVPIEEAPDWFKTSTFQESLAREIKSLRVDSTRTEIQEDLADCAIAYSTDDWLCPLAKIRKSSTDTSNLFEQFSEPGFFLGTNNQNPIIDLVRNFDIDDALSILEDTSQDFLTVWRNSPEQLITLIDWFLIHRAEFKDNDALTERLRQLPIWPSGSNLHVLEELFIPSQADVPLQMDRIVDQLLLKHHRSFLIEALHATELTASMLATLLQEAGLNHRIPPEEIPEWFRSQKFRKALVFEIESLLVGVEISAIQQTFSSCAIVYSADGWLSPLGSIRKISAGVTDVFSQLTEPGRFLGRDNPRVLRSLVRDFDVNDAIKLIEEVPTEVLNDMWNNTPHTIIDFIGWFEKQRELIKQNYNLRNKLWQLPIWPSGNQLYPLDNLVLPSDNKQPLQLEGCIEAQLIKLYYSFFSEVLQATRLTASVLADKILDAGLDAPTLFENAPEWIKSDEVRSRLYDEISLFLAREGQDEVKEVLADCAIVLSVEGYFCPLRHLKETNVKTIELFSPISPQNYFLNPNTKKEIKSLVDQFDLIDAIDLIDNQSHDDLEHLWRKTPEKLVAIIGWFADHQADIRDRDLQLRIGTLKMWPSGNELYILDNLVVPGDFEDQLGLAQFVDNRIVRKHRSFLTDTLKAKSLTLIVYAGKLIPREFESDREISAENKRQLVNTLAEHLNRLRDYPEIQVALAQCALVECQNDNFYQAPRTYFNTEAVKDILEADALIARISSDRPHIVNEFLEWLGVENTPQPADIITRVRKLVTPPASPVGENRRAIQRLFSRLGQDWDKFETHGTELIELKTLKWLPARGDDQNWYAPGDGIYATYEMGLFETQALFLDTSDKSRQLIDFLRILYEATADQVVDHLLVCSKQGLPIKNSYIYQNLNQRFINNPAILRLTTEASIHLGKGLYARPDQVFWEDPGLGKFRHQLDRSWGEHETLLEKLGVRDHLEPEDILLVLREISDEYNKNHPQSLDEETHNVVLRCWTLLNEALENNSIRKEDIYQLTDDEIRAIPNNQKILCQPGLLFIEDRPKLAQKFEPLTDYIIPRTRGMWQAMKAAGVQLLSEAVQTELVEPIQTTSSEELKNRFKERRILIERVVSDWDLNLLDRLDVEVVNQLTVKHTIWYSNDLIETKPEKVSAFYHVEREILYIQEKKRLPWPAISYELAYALNPEANISQIAGNFSTILETLTFHEANEALDMLGYPPLKEMVEVNPVSYQPVHADNDEDLQTDNDYTEADEELEGVSNFVDTPSSRGHQQQPTERVNGKPLISPTNKDASPSSVGSFVEDILGEGKVGKPEPGKSLNHNFDGGTTSPSKPNTTSEQTGRVSGSTGQFPRPVDYEPHPRTPASDASPHHSQKKSDSQNKHRQGEPVGVLTHRVVSDSDHTTDVQQDVENSRNMRINRAGVARVLESEKLAGFKPEEMIHDQAGYDVISKNENGEIIRYIEVKSRAGDWDRNGVALSAHQFCAGLRFKEQFWLYIVERAEQDDFNIIKFQNPVASQKHEFIFKPR